jgi:anti-sigma regulatory factor (Ser/Thr protein kinase)
VPKENVANFPRHSLRTVTWEYRLSPHLDSIAKARRHVRHALDPHTGEDTLSCVELVVSELVTNSVCHGPGAPITLRLVSEADGGIAGEVEDHGDGMVAIRELDLETGTGGLGLPVVDRLTSAWGVHPDSTHVWFRFDAA